MTLRGFQNLGNWKPVTSVYQEGGAEKRPCEGQGFKGEKATVWDILKFEVLVKCTVVGMWNKQSVV